MTNDPIESTLADVHSVFVPTHAADITAAAVAFAHAQRFHEQSRAHAIAFKQHSEQEMNANRMQQPMQQQPAPLIQQSNNDTSLPPPPALLAATSAPTQPQPQSALANVLPTKKSTVRYAAERIIGNGSFGIVYQASVIGSGETVAIKKVLQDPKFKNRELQMMSALQHDNIIALRHCFYSRGDKQDEVYLNLVMDYIPDTIHRCLRTYTKANKLLPLMTVKCYMYQIARSLAYIHSVGIAHRDIKPQNILLHPRTHQIKLCDFGSAKQLVAGEPNVAYICSRYYRAPELVFEATQYTTAIDIWSAGCVMAEMLLGQPLFPGESAVDQLIEIVKILGTPTKQQIFGMNPNHKSFSFPQISAHPWSTVFRTSAHVTADALHLIDCMLTYEPNRRITALEMMAHPFFDDLRQPNARMPGQHAMPHNLFQFTQTELRLMQERNLQCQIVPQHLWNHYQVQPPMPHLTQAHMLSPASSASSSSTNMSDTA